VKSDKASKLNSPPGLGGQKRTVGYQATAGYPAYRWKASMSKRLPISTAGTLVLVIFMCFCERVSAAPKMPSGKTTLQANAANQTIIITMPSHPKPLLDTAAVRKLYMDGDFEVAIELLETGMMEIRPYSHDDSVFIFKHLGVMYAAKYETRERGKYFMHKLLLTEPTARIMDMYASDMIYMIFKNIQDEFDSTRGKLSRAENHVMGNSQPEPNTESAKPKDLSIQSSNHALIWVGATTAALAAGIVAYFIFEDESKTITKHSSYE
jgi:hypothetical protein